MAVSIILPKLSAGREAIVREGLRQGIYDACLQEVDPDKVAIKGFDRPDGTHPEIGIGIGITAIREITFAVNPARIDAPVFQSDLARLVTHELNHVQRADNYGIEVITLADALISEGLAQASEVTAGHAPVPWRSFYSAWSAQHYIHAALPELDKPLGFGTDNNRYMAWFFGTDPRTTDPRFGGYPLGHAIVERYMLHTQQDIVAATRMSAETIIAHWRNDLKRQGIAAWVENNLEIPARLSPARPRTAAAVPALTFTIR